MSCQQLQTNLRQLKDLYKELSSLDRKLNSVKQADRQTKESVYRELDHIQAQAKDHIKQIEDVVYYYPTIERAQEILGSDNVLGPKEVEKTFGIHLKKIPKIPFSQAELERAKTLGQMLVLRVDRTNDDRPLSLQAMVDIIQPRWDREGKGKLLDTTSNYQNWQEITGNDWSLKPPRAGWALVSKQLLPDSPNKNYVQQTEVIIAYLKDTVFKDREILQVYEEAFAEWEQVKQTDRNIKELLNHPDDPKYNNQEATKKLNELKIIPLTRQSIQEVVYDLAIYFDKNNQRLLRNVYTWSNSSLVDDSFVIFGYFNMRGISGTGRPPNIRGALGILLSIRH